MSICSRHTSCSATLYADGYVVSKRLHLFYLVIKRLRLKSLLYVAELRPSSYIIFYIFIIAHSNPEVYLDVFNVHNTAIKKFLQRGPYLVDVNMHNPHSISRPFMDALHVFWPGLQVGCSMAWRRSAIPIFMSGILLSFLQLIMLQAIIINSSSHLHQHCRC